MEEFMHSAGVFITQFFRMIRVNDVIDIILIAYACYFVLKLVRESRAMQLLRGIIILLVATQVSAWLDLNTVNFILRNTVEVGVLALLIIFQPEFRRALDKVGRTTFSKFIPGEGTGAADDALDQICSAVSAMSENRIGALIVFERDTKIGDIIRTGVSLNADISAELIINIFMVNTPLHDGALIIKDGKITAAACFLPLTQNEDLSTELGTRHRAAIGVTEISDAVVIVVSEETGKVSFAKDGALSRNMSMDALKRAVQRSFDTESSATNGVLAKWKERIKNGK